MIERHDVIYVVVWHALAKLRAAAKERGIAVDRIRGLGWRPVQADGQPTPPQLRANLLGMSERFSAHRGAPIAHTMPDGKEGSSGRTVSSLAPPAVDQETGDERDRTRAAVGKRV